MESRTGRHGCERFAERMGLTFGSEIGHADWVCALPADLLEPHPLVRELRGALHKKEVELARTQREVARLRVAVAFGLRRIPQETGGRDAGEAPLAEGAGAS